MAMTNSKAKQINYKVLYLGPRYGGKRTTLRSIFNSTSSEAKTGLRKLEKKDGMNSFYEFLPISIGYVGNHHLRLNLFTLPYPSAFEVLEQVMLRDIDGIVFVLDSSFEKVQENIDGIQVIRKQLEKAGVRLRDLPHIFQYNKRDCEDAIDIASLSKEVNPHHMPEVESVAIEGKGTTKPVTILAKIFLEKFSQKLTKDSSLAT